MKITRAEAQVLETNAHTPEYLIREVRRKLDESEGRQITVNVKSGDLATVRWILNPHKFDKPRHVLFSLAAAVLIGGSMMILPGSARAHRIDTCAVVAGAWAGDDVPIHAAGCDEDGSRNGNACNRYATRLAHRELHRDGDLSWLDLETIAERVEATESNGHPCEQFEDGTYGFPTKMIDCMVDPRC